MTFFFLSAYHSVVAKLVYVSRVGEQPGNGGEDSTRQSGPIDILSVNTPGSPISY